MIVRNVMKTIDQAKLSSIQEKYKNFRPDPGSGKYLNVQKWLGSNLNLIFDMELHHGNSLQILDLGAGCGYFPYLCKYYGHSVITIDIDENRCSMK